MITYTKKNVKLLTFSLTIILFIIFHLILSDYFFSKPFRKFYFSQDYSKSIPIHSKIKNDYILYSKSILSQIINQKQSLKNSTKTVQQSVIEEEKEVIKVQNQNNVEQPKTQRQIVKENKNNTWRVQIPKININVHINEGTSSSVLLKSVGHFEETSKWSGNVGLAAHNRGYKCNFFQNIKKLKEGDEIIYTTTNGKKVYKVQTNKVISETDWSYLEQTQDNRITLITCEENRREYRRCIQAVEVANYAK